MDDHLSKIKGVYAITPSGLDTQTLSDRVTLAIQGGASLIQYRDKLADAPKRLSAATALKKICRKYRVPLIINDDLTLAKKLDCDGVHLGQSDLSLDQARFTLGEKKIIGITCHGNLNLAKRAAQSSANYVALGAFYPSPTKPDATVVPLSLINEAKNNLSIPIVAIGGITQDNAHQIISSGADAIAVVDAIFGQTDPLVASCHLALCFRKDNK